MKKMKASGYAQILVKAEFEYDPNSVMGKEKQAEKALEKAAKNYGVDTFRFDFGNSIEVYDHGM